MPTRTVEYQCEGTRLVGHLFLPEGSAGAPVPGVLVAHDWGGCNDNARGHAKGLADLGYAGFAIDMYGEGRTGNSVEENAALMGAVKSDRSVLIARINAALSTLKEQPEVDGARTGAVGFCFGGLCVLDLARSGADVGGVISMHGLLDAPPAELCKPITAQVLVCHGYRDPMAPPEHMLALCKELEAADCDFQVHAYGRAVHAFTNPAANMPAMGAVYDAPTDKRAMRSMRDFFADLFG